ncbi:hypothetical protein CTAYLR_006676 [Chrysophaeum taylorii]|uniref:Uncharacterized protein n=1 Tax=Chrysophaeum taylorii TaxID=2483200 RepID=A0AAD7XLP5_9STRA|nr:hypothetical protein CTAYLR_006676 [Chrysophaeum taylorii]
MYSTPGEGWSSQNAPALPRRVRIKETVDELGGEEASRLPSLQGPKSASSSSSSGQTLNASTNVMLLYRLHNLQHMSLANFSLGLLALSYAATCVVLLVLNVGDNNDEDCGDPEDVRTPRCGSTVSEQTLHRLEFWAGFSFTLVTAFSLMFTPKAVSHIYENPVILKLVLLFQIVLALIPALLVTANLEVYERPSHELEYLNELTIAFVDLILFASLVREDDDEDDEENPKLFAPSNSVELEDFGARGMPRGGATLFPVIACIIAGVQMAVYNSGRWIDGAEKLAHYFEFTFGIISAFVTFWFCMDNRFACDSEIMEILYGTHRDCLNCTLQCKELEDYRVATNVSRRRPSIVQTIRRKFARSFSSVSDGAALDSRRHLMEAELARSSNVAPEQTPGQAGYDACCSTTRNTINS